MIGIVVPPLWDYKGIIIWVNNENTRPDIPQARRQPITSVGNSLVSQNQALPGLLSDTPSAIMSRHLDITTFSSSSSVSSWGDCGNLQLKYSGWNFLPSYIGIVISHVKSDKDSYQPINIMEYYKGFLNAAHLLQNSSKTSQGLVGGLSYQRHPILFYHTS